jgi:hypothetical protein
MTLAILTALLKPVAVSVFSGVGAGLITSLKKTVKAERPERIDILKLSRTGGTAAIIGLVAYFQGYEITSLNYDSYVAANAGVVMAVESLLSYLKRRFIK